MSEISDRIVKRMREVKIKQVDLVDTYKLSKGTVSKWVSGVNTPNGENLNSLAKALKTTSSWILYGEEAKEDSNVTSLDDARHVQGKLPVLSWVQAGVWTESMTISNSELAEIKDWLPAPPDARKNSFYLQVKGISNSPEYLDGEFICIDPNYQIDEIQTGEMVVARCNGDTTFKALVNGENGRYLKALNPAWTPQIIHLDENCHLIGKYIGSYKPPKRHNV